MASWRKIPRKDGSFTFQVLYRIDGRQSSQPLADQESAEMLVSLIKQVGAKRALEIHGLSSGPLRQGAPMTVGEWVRHHIDHLTGVEQKTLDDYNRYLRMDIGPFLGEVPLTALSYEDITGWIKRLETTKRQKTGRVPTPKTIANLHGFLSGALAAAVPKHIPSNPCTKVRLPRVTGSEDAEDIRMLSRDEFGLLLGGFRPYWHPLLEFLVASGCRWSEATALKPSDVDQTKGVVKIRRAWKYSSNGYTMGKPKTKRSRRDINLPPTVLQKLSYHNEWLFVNTAGSPIRYHSFRSNVWDHSLASTTLDPKPTPHDLRHTCASWMLNAGVPITTVSRHLGHENISTTVNIYGDVDRASAQVAADVMGKLLG